MILRKFLQLLFKRFFQILFILYYGRIYFDENQIIKKEKIEIKEISFDNKIYNANGILYQISKARIYTDNVENVGIIKNNKLIPNISFQQISGILKDPSFNKVIKAGTPRIMKKFEGNVLSLVQGGSGNNYFHFLFDIIIKIELCRNIIPLEKIDYFYMYGKEKWQLDILKVLDINEDKLIDSYKFRHIKGSNIIALEHPWYNKGLFQEGVNNLPNWIILFLRDRFINNAKKFNNSEYIYIDRSDSVFNRCKLINNDEIIHILAKNGFKSYKVSELNFYEQIYLFNKAKVIIGPHGAAFSNLIFSNKNLKLFEIIPSDHLSLKCKNFSNVLGFKYNRFMLDRVANKNGDMILDKEKLELILNSI